MSNGIVNRVEDGLSICSTKELQQMTVFNKNGDCLLSQEFPGRELLLRGLEGTLLVVLNFVEGDYFVSVIY